MTGKAHQIIQFLNRLGSTPLLERLVLATGLPVEQFKPDTPDDPEVLTKIDFALNMLLNTKERRQLEAFLGNPQEEPDAPLNPPPQAPFPEGNDPMALGEEDEDDDEYIPTIRMSVDDLLGEEDEPTLLRLESIPDEEVFGEFEDEPTVARWKTTSSQEIDVSPLKQNSEEKDQDSQ